MKSGKIISAAAAATGFLSMSLAVLAALPPTATLIPAPREMRVTGGEYWAKKPPKMEKVDGIPPEGYELSIRPDGMTIRYSDDAGAYYANMTLFHTGRGDAKAKCKVFPCLEIRDWPQFRWRGVMVDDSRHFMGKDTILCILEQMSWFKLNVFHWHLTDDQLWSLEIPGDVARACDTDPLDSIRWLMRKAKKYHTTVSLHVNLFDGSDMLIPAERDGPNSIVLSFFNFYLLEE